MKSRQVLCLLSALDIVSANPGSESFTLKYDGGFDLNVNIKDVPEIDARTSDFDPCNNFFYLLKKRHRNKLI